MGLLAVDVQLMPLEGVVVHVGVGVQVVVVMDVQLVVGEASAWLRSVDAALVMVALAVASGETALVVSAGRLVAVARGEATTTERNAPRSMKRVVRENI